MILNVIRAGHPRSPRQSQPKGGRDRAASSSDMPKHATENVVRNVDYETWLERFVIKISDLKK